MSAVHEPDTLLSLRGFGVAFGERTILSAVDLHIPDRHLCVLLGPGGTGKSTLLRTLAGFNDSNPSLRTWGQAWYCGRPLTESTRPALVSQSARLMMASLFENIVHELPERHALTNLEQRDLAQRLLLEAGLKELLARLDEPVIHLSLAEQRHIATLRLVAASPRLLLLDEPTTGLSDEEAARFLAYLLEEAKRRSVLIVLHNQAQARRLGGTVALLAGGAVQAVSPSETFFGAPASTAARDFVRTGSCALPAPDADPATLDPAVLPRPPLPPAARAYVSDSFGPRGFLWLKKSRLAGTPRPGIVDDIDYDLKALKRVGITCLVTLTRTPPDTAALARHAIENVWLPIDDMGAPSLVEAARLCQTLDGRLAAGDVIAVHCRAGLGRTGTILAAYLIWEGQSALSALESARRIEPRWVQSDIQVKFLEQFARVLSGAGQHRPPAMVPGGM